MTRTSEIRTVAVLGANVAGTTAAILLARAGRAVHIFDKSSTIDPRVGESLLPPAVPILRRLLPEDVLRNFALVKPGLTFVLRTGRRLSFDLSNLQGISSTYSYNVPRPKFDKVLQQSALSQGVHLVRQPAIVHAEGDRIVLADVSLSLIGEVRQPDLIVDATGRAQLITRKLNGKILSGGRSALALYAHFCGVDLGAPAGHAVISPMEYGWCWRIPLQDRVSVGVVMSRQKWTEFGNGLRQKLENVLMTDAILGRAMRQAERQTEVSGVAYHQYESERFWGENWALVGDAAGFVDPTLSPGVTVALQGASELADCIGGPDRDLSIALARWETRAKKRLRGWGELVAGFYDGSLFAIIQQGEDYSSEMPWLGPLSRHLKRSIGAAMVGARTASIYNLSLIRFLTKKGLVRYRPADWAIR